MNKIIELIDISKIYSDKTYTVNVLQNLNFTANCGETIAITGTSGSGKSTLLHILGLLDTPNHGKIIYFDEEISINNKNVELFRNKHIGFVFQFHYLLADFTAYENVALPAVIAGLSWSEATKKAKEILAELDLDKRYNHYPNQLSGGEQQRVAIARAMINTPDIIIADEPTGNLDKKHSMEIINIFEELNLKKNQTIILATHDLEIASRMKKHYTINNSALEINIS